MTEIIWQDPPEIPHAGRKSEWIPRLTPLMAHPKRWALVRTFSKQGSGRTTVYRLNHGRIPVPPGKWEFTSRTNSDGDVDAYARYLGPDE